ncbi:MAG TPA: methylmalonyl-CoA epimerase [Jiangellaceae bacterium]|jgi:methylmalonyl-CoA/ethylmalonyl-CoA epimerase|nr:methylmalonyl-CoA epimerase [Jiangellaceae bacterium]
MTGLFSAVDHVGIAVADLDEAIVWYARTFGMQVVHEEVNEEMGVREAMLRVGDEPSGAEVQLLAPLHSDTTIGRFLDRFGPGIQQLAYRVEDIDAVTRTLQERGIEPLYQAPRRGTAGARVNFIHPKDAGGVLIELIEPPRSDVLREQ